MLCIILALKYPAATLAQHSFFLVVAEHVMELIQPLVQVCGLKRHTDDSSNAFVVSFAKYVNANCLGSIGCVNDVLLRLPPLKMYGVMMYGILHIYLPRMQLACIVCQWPKYHVFNRQMLI
jgi:hypothetical protein